MYWAGAVTAGLRGAKQTERFQFAARFEGSMKPMQELATESFCTAWGQGEDASGRNPTGRMVNFRKAVSSRGHARFRPMPMVLWPMEPSRRGRQPAAHRLPRTALAEIESTWFDRKDGQQHGQTDHEELCAPTSRASVSVHQWNAHILPPALRLLIRIVSRGITRIRTACFLPLKATAPVATNALTSLSQSGLGLEVGASRPLLLGQFVGFGGEQQRLGLFSRLCTVTESATSLSGMRMAFIVSVRRPRTTA